jgi:SH3-like domain-containing protein
MRLLLGTVLFILMGAGNIHAEMLAVSENLADIRSSPSPTVSTVLLQVPRYYPLQAGESRNGFLKISDYLGNSGWIRKSSADNIRTVIVNVAGRVNIREDAGSGSKIIFKARKGVCFKVLAEKGDWLQVEHETGVKGWIFKDLVWAN